MDQADAWGFSRAIRLNMEDTSSTLSLIPSISSFAIMEVMSSHSLMAARPSSEKEPSIMPATASLEAMSLMALCCMVC